MSLSTGQVLSFYEILGSLGAGGMGEVYRARDTRLEREVAIKVLPEELADDGERLRRFEREAKTLASLNHPNVAGIHGVDQQGDVCFLVLELVPGEDLAQRLARGALPVAEAIEVCRQIAEGLEAAHEAGVVHRDLKPANVRVTPEGAVKLLDFGLAKPILPEASDSGTTTAESDSFLMTEEGLVLGTPTYMSPEQARGKPVDRRTDIWAFGCVLYECLTGRRAFEGSSLTDILAAIVGEEPDMSRLPAVPASVRALLERCLVKDPRTRLRDIGEARVLLQREDLERGGLEAPGGSGGSASGAASRSRGARVALVASGGVILGAAIGVFGLDPLRDGGASRAAIATEAAQPSRVRRFSQPALLDAEGEKVAWEATFLSPDGNHLAVTTRDGIVVRQLDSLDTIVVAAGEEPTSVAWSPDSEYLAYTAGDEVVRVSRRGTSAVRLYSTSDESRTPQQIAWLDDGRIVFGVGGREGASLQSIPEAGGAATDLGFVAELSRAGHFHGITPVPGGRFLAVVHYFVEKDGYSVITGDDSGVRTFFKPPGQDVLAARWVPGDYLLFSQGAEEESETWAVRLSMDPFEVAGEPFFIQGGLGGASVSMDGTLAYVEQGQGLKHRLAWWSPDGTLEPIGREHDDRIGSVHLSRESGTIVYTQGSPPSTELWRYDLRREVSTEIPTGDRCAVMARTLPGGRIAFTALDLAADALLLESFVLPASGRGEAEEWLEGAVLGVDPEMRHALVMSAESVMDADLYVTDLASGESRDFRVGPETAAGGSISPDGEWALFSSGDNRSPQVILTRFPSGEGEWQVSVDGGTEATFSPDGSEIYFIEDRRKLYRVSLQTEPEVLLGAPELLGVSEEGWMWTTESEGESGRFLATQELGAVAGDLVVVLDWAAELAGR